MTFGINIPFSAIVSCNDYQEFFLENLTPCFELALLCQFYVRFITLLCRATIISLIIRVVAGTEVLRIFHQFFLSVIEHLCFRLLLFCMFYSRRE